ncbi:restriction endonuclease [Arcicella lustrica]|uniref:Restriction endonuclease n=1 Tax=Arcicella lustrica TaxID=2984196 RepID=A0ABU5SH96_9BACT|nr:restriction endonuclease [Arcicella sp. DC25W]MEA5426399.1 restriction endonuclease [Arcicella sp. DC25W]
MITSSIPNTWSDLQDKVSDILTQCGFSVETEKTVQTVRGSVELDVYAIETIKGRKYSIICECKYWKSRIPQNVIHAFRSVVGDLGANVGYVISLNGFQKGAFNVSELTNIELVTWEEFQTFFFETWYDVYFSKEMASRLNPLLTYSEPILPAWFDKMSREDKEIYYSLKDKYDVLGHIVMNYTHYGRMLGNKPIPLLPVINILSQELEDQEHIARRVPENILTETGYLEFLHLVEKFGAVAISEFRVLRDKYINTDYRDNDE